MKKTLAIILAIIMIISVSLIFTGCNSISIKQFFSGKEPSSVADISAGGWVKVKSPVITEEFRKAFDSAAGEMTGMHYEAVAFLESQVVAGRNYLVLCKGTSTAPGARTFYSLVKVYENLSGKVEITSATDSTIEAIVTADLDGGWYAPETPEVTKEAKNALEKASETLTGATYSPVALLGTQVVAGTNYALLCEMTSTVPDYSSEYVTVYVYEDLQGNAEITETKNFYNNYVKAPVEPFARKMETLPEAEKTVGFEITLPESLDKIDNYTVIDDKILEINFEGGFIRKSKLTEDILLGGYTDFPTEKEVEINSKTVVLKAKDELFYYAFWDSGDYSYCVSISDGTTEAELTEIVSGIE